MQQAYLHFIGKFKKITTSGEEVTIWHPQVNWGSTLVLPSQCFMHTLALKVESPGFAWAKAPSKLMYSHQVHLPPSPPIPSAPSCTSSSKNPFGQTLQQLPSASLSVKISQLDRFLLLCNLLSNAYWGWLHSSLWEFASLFHSVQTCCEQAWTKEWKIQKMISCWHCVHLVSPSCS